MTAPVRLALFGAGLIGVRHLGLAAAEPACEIVALADPMPAARATAQDHGVNAYADPLELLDAEQVNGVIIATPNQLHAGQALACIERGLPVLVEKPVTDTLESGDALASAAQSAGVPVLVGHHRRYDPGVVRAHELLGEGCIGQLAAVQCTWALRKHDSYYEAAWRTERPGGGPTLINLIHDIDILRYLCGDITRLQAEGSTLMRGHEVEDTLALTLRFASGAIGTVIASDATPSPWGWEMGSGENPHVPYSGRDCYRLMGTTGSMELPELKLWRHTDVAEWREPLVCDSVEIGRRAALADQLRHFCAVVRGETAPRIDARDGLETLRTTLAVLDAIDTGSATVLLEPTINSGDKVT